MEMTELTVDERMVLIGLIAKMVSADAEISAEELQELDELADELGMGSLTEAVEKARHRPLDEVMNFAGAVERTDAQRLIHTVLVDMASVDGVSGDEANLLSQIETLWGITRGR